MLWRHDQSSASEPHISTVRYSTVQYSAVQYIKVQCTEVPHYAALSLSVTICPWLCRAVLCFVMPCSRCLYLFQMIPTPATKQAD